MKSIKTKLILVVTAIVTFLLIVQGSVNLFVTKSKLEEAAKNTLISSSSQLHDLISESEQSIKALKENSYKSFDYNLLTQVDNIMSLLHTYERKVKKQELSEKEAQKEAIAAIRQLKSRNGGYFFIDDTNYNIILQPTDPKKEGINRENAVDENGFQYAKAFVDGALKNNEFFVNYYFPKPDNPQKAFPKRTHTRLFSSWGWVVGTGNYVDDIEDSILEEEKVFNNTVTNILAELGKDGAALVLNSKSEFEYFSDPKMVGNKIEVKDVKTGEDVIEKIMNSKNKTISYTIKNPISGKVQKEIGHVHYDEKNDRYFLVSKNYDEVFKGVSQIIKSSTIIFIVGIALSIVLVIIFAKSFIRPILEIQELSEQVSQGNLNVLALQVNTKDEVGSLATSINIMVEKIRVLIKDAASISQTTALASEKLASASHDIQLNIEQVSATTEELASGSANQAYDAEKTMDASHLLSENMEQIYKLTENMKQHSAHLNEATINGINNAGISLEQIQRIEETANYTSHVIQSLREKTNDISSILKVINDISAQTNLLALNAAIEAARAGEHGKGFAVVAGEVRKLAEETSNSTEKISAIIKSVEMESKLANDSVENMVKQVEKGLTATKDNKDSFENMVEIINDLIEYIQTVAQDTNKNHTQIQEMVKLVENIAAVTEESSAGTQELAAAMQEQNNSIQGVNTMAQQLAQLSKKLSDTIAYFEH